MASVAKPSTRRARMLRPRKSYKSQPSSFWSFKAAWTAGRSNMRHLWGWFLFLRLTALAVLRTAAKRASSAAGVGDEAAHFVFVLVAGTRLHAAGHVHCVGPDHAHRFGNVVRGQAAGQNQRNSGLKAREQV